MFDTLKRTLLLPFAALTLSIQRNRSGNCDAATENWRITHMANARFPVTLNNGAAWQSPEILPDPLYLPDCLAQVSIVKSGEFWAVNSLW